MKLGKSCVEEFLLFLKIMGVIFCIHYAEARGSTLAKKAGTVIYELKKKDVCFSLADKIHDKKIQSKIIDRIETSKSGPQNNPCTLRASSSLLTINPSTLPTL